MERAFLQSGWVLWALLLLVGCGTPSPDPGAPSDASQDLLATSDGADASGMDQAPGDAGTTSDGATEGGDASPGDGTTSGMDGASAVDGTMDDGMDALNVDGEPSPRDGPAIETTTRDSTSVDLGPSLGPPTLRLVSPRAGTTVRGVVSLVFVANAPDGVAGLAVLLDGRPVVDLGEGPGTVTYDLAAVPAGMHDLGVRLTDRRGATAMDSARVTVQNPAFALEELYTDRAQYGPDDEVVFTSVWRGTGFRLEADFSALDSLYDPARVTVRDDGSGRFTARYRLSRANARADGRYPVTVTATDRGAPELRVQAQVPVRYARLPVLPLAVTGSVARPGAPPTVAVAAAGEAPRVLSITGETRLSRGGSVAWTVAWDRRPEAPATLLELSVAGFDGYLALPLTDPSATRVTVNLSLPASRTLAPGTWRATVRVVDALRRASQGAPRDLVVDSLGMGGGGDAVFRGTVSYYKRILTALDPCATPSAVAWTLRPAAAQPELRVVNTVDGSTVAGTVGAVEVDGSYALRVPARAGRYRVEVLARGAGAISVVGASDSVYVVASAELPTLGAGVETLLDLRASRENPAPFSMLETMSEARSATVALLGGAPPPLSVQWAAGTAAASTGGSTGFAFSGACGVPAPGDRGRIFVNGAGATADEWDDPVLRHEFGHFVACVYSRDESHGGRHSLSERVVPTLAWSEGFANFWGQFLVQERCIWNTASDAIRIYYIDNTPIPPDGPPSPLNTSPTDDASGAVSEGLVAGVLWALSQLSPPTPWSGAPFDALAPLLWSFQSYLTATRVGDYGASGVDLADFLAGWICAAPCYDAELREIAVGTWSYNYKNRSSFAQCPSPYAVPDGGPRRCAGPYAYVLTEAELQRYRFDGALVNRMPLGAAGSLGLATGRNARSLAVLRADGPAPTRAAVSSFSDGTLALYTIAGGREREVDFDPSSPTVDRLSVGMSPRGVAVTPDGRYAFVAVSASDEVVVVDLDERALCKRIAVPREPGSSDPSVPDSIAFLPRARCRSGSTLRGDTCTAYVSLRGTPAAPGHALALLDVQRATDCDGSGGEVSGYVTELGGGPMPSPAALALEPGGARLAVLGTVSNTVVILDTATNTPVDLMPSVPSEGPFRTGSTPSVVAWFADASRVVFGNILGRLGTRLAGNGVVRLGTLSTGETTYDVGVNNAVYSLVVSSDGTRVYVGDQGGNITALEVSRFTGFPTYPAAATERTGGCLDTRNRAVACAPAASAGASVRAMIQL